SAANAPGTQVRSKEPSSQARTAQVPLATSEGAAPASDRPILPAGETGRDLEDHTDPPKRPVIKPRPLHGLLAIFIKEFAHIRRQPSTLMFMLVIPVMQTLIFGYAIQTQIENIPVVVLDL